MPARTPELRRAIGRNAIVQRHHRDDPIAVADARRLLAEARAEQYVRELVAAAPPLGVETRARLAAILLTDRPDAGAVA